MNNNALKKSLYGGRSAPSTEPSANSASALSRSVTATSGSENNIRENLVSTPLPSGQLLLSDAPTRAVDGVIAEVGDQTVLINLSLPGGTFASIRLPPVLIPDNILEYGTPVKVTLDTSGGVRRPIVEKRTIAPRPLERSAEIDDWLQSIT
jgi:hypothetical protein